MPAGSRSAVLLVGLGLAVLASQSCSGDSTGPDGPGTPSSITVTSSVDTILALGRATILQATARDAGGRPITGLQFTWSSSNPSVVSVGSSGVATAEGVGAATVTARTGGASGSLRLHVVDADLGTVGALTGDPFAEALLAGLSAAVGADVGSAWDACSAGASDRNVVTILEGVADFRDEAASATDPTDRASLAVLGLFVDRIERALGL